MKRILVASGAVLTAALSLTALSAASADSTTEQAPARAAAPASTTSSDAPVLKSSTSVAITVVNNTGQTLTLLDQYKAHGSWGQQFPQTIGVGDSPTASASSSNVEGIDIAADYSAPDGTIFHLEAQVPFFGTDSTGQDVSGTNAALYTISHTSISGFNPTVTFTLGRA
ncbi:hypothetical protein [Kineococcus sp. SYSU DK003]|uniref:hypothetical protein n=1 Tax=Kineococcus sp. SYSU DK003 TaxID=3383124 RepID=UPI003D7EB4BF